MTVCVNGISSYNINSAARIDIREKNNTAEQPIRANTSKVCFKGTNDQTSIAFRTKLSTKEEQETFKTVSKELGAEEKKLLNDLLKSGILLKDNSDDKSTVLENLRQIATTPRAEGLDKKVILKNIIQTIAYPYAINQKLGDIPENYKAPILQSLLDNKEFEFKTLQEADEKFKDLHSSTCPTACVEFNLASKHQAEFARFAKDLTSPKMVTEKIVDLRNLSKNTAEAVWLLNAFKAPYEVIDQNRVKITLKPDKDAIIRARMQTTHQDGMERNATDVMIQSMLMNLGTQQTYNSLIDERKGGIFFKPDNTGLIEFEKTFIESVAENKSTTSMLYQQVDDNMVVSGYECDFATTKQQILDTLKRDQNVIIGITYFEKDKEMPDLSKPQDTIAGGHEITIVGAKTDKNGETYFICQDSDDEVNMPIEYPESWLLPRLHHAGLPEDIAERTMKDMKDNWQISLDNYKQMKNVS